MTVESMLHWAINWLNEPVAAWSVGNGFLLVLRWMAYAVAFAIIVVVVAFYRRWRKRRTRSFRRGHDGKLYSSRNRGELPKSIKTSLTVGALNLPYIVILEFSFELYQDEYPPDILQQINDVMASAVTNFILGHGLTNNSALTEFGAKGLQECAQAVEQRLGIDILNIQADVGANLGRTWWADKKMK